MDGATHPQRGMSDTATENTVTMEGADNLSCDTNGTTHSIKTSINAGEKQDG